MSSVVLDMGQAGPGRLQRLPELRHDIHIYPGARARDGSPTWTLYDPARNRFFSLGWKEHAMLSRWDKHSEERIAEAVNRDTTLTLSGKDVRELAQFLVEKNLVIIEGQEGIDRLASQRAGQHRQHTGKLLQKYLFYRIPLARPDRFLSATAGWLDGILTKQFALLLLLGLLTGLYLTTRQWDSFTTTFSYLYSTTGMAWLVVALVFAKTAHELGHAWMAKRYGLRVPTMGIAFLVLWPVLYTDTTEAWKLTSRKQRLAISAAGIAAELVVAIIALLLWNLLPDSPARSAIFVIATTSWVITLLVNINPFVRFDGYYLLADYLGIPNLQDRSFELARWKLREMLFGLDEPEPGTVAAGHRRFLVLFAWATWLYRLLLFTGIALFVYHVLFKTAGILLLAAVISWFVARPLVAEFSAWRALRNRMHWNRQSFTSLVLLTAAILLLLLPWDSHFNAPAVARYTGYAHIYPPEKSRIVTVFVQPGDSVSAGQELFRLESPELEHRRLQADSNVEQLQLQLAQGATQSHLREAVRILQSELAQALSEQEGYRELQERLSIKSPHDGVAAEVADALVAGRWVNTELRLAMVVDTSALAVDAWLEESAIGKVQAGDRARFYPDNPQIAPFDIQVASVGRSALTVLDEVYQASLYGGDIGVREQADGRLVPNKAIYRLRLVPVDEAPQTDRVLPGEVRIEGEAQSLASRAWQSVAAILVRESGF